MSVIKKQLVLEESADYDQYKRINNINKNSFVVYIKLIPENTFY